MLERFTSLDSDLKGDNHVLNDCTSIVNKSGNYASIDVSANTTHVKRIVPFLRFVPTFRN